MEIKLNKDISVDLTNLLETRLLIQANSGGGKSWLLRRLLEQSHGKVQQIIIDLEGEFSTLREKYDYILAGKGGDIPAEPRSAGLLAHKILELGVSTIVDLYELNHYDRKRFVRLFLESMVNAPKDLWHNVLVVIDEAHVFCPERGDAESSEAVIDLMTRGRKRGFCGVLATQRISKLHKDAAAECNNKLIGRTGLDIDRKRASEELGFTTKEQSLSLRTLGAGEFYAFGSALSNEIITLKVGEVKTSHPQAGMRISKTVTPPTEKIKSVLKKLTDLPEEAKKEAQTIAEFKTEIQHLRTQIRQNQQKNGETDPQGVQRAVSVAVATQAREFNLEKRKFNDEMSRLSSIFAKIVSLIPQTLPKFDITANVLTGGDIKKAVEILQIPIPNKKPVVNMFPGELLYGEEKELAGGALRMLKVLVSRYPVKLSKALLGTFAKMKPRGGSFGTYLSTLRSRGFIQDAGDLLTATEAGIDCLGAEPNPPQTPEEVIELWKSNLTGGAKRMFEILVECYPESRTKEVLGELAGVTHTGGSFGTYLSILRSNNLVEVTEGEVKLAEHIYNI